MEPELDFEALAEGFRERGFALARYLLGNPEDAADAVQEALTVAWARRDTIERGRDPTAWFFTVLRNTCVDLMRRRGIRQHAPIEPELAEDVSTPRPGEQSERDEFVTRLTLEMQKLELQHREILLLRDYQNLSYARIAEILGIPTGTVMSRLHRARMVLRERMKDML